MQNTKLPSKKDFKLATKLLKLLSFGLLKHQQSLDLLSETYGFKNWHVVKAKYDSEELGVQLKEDDIFIDHVLVALDKVRQDITIPSRHEKNINTTTKDIETLLVLMDISTNEKEYLERIRYIDENGILLFPSSPEITRYSLQKMMRWYEVKKEIKGMLKEDGYIYAILRKGRGDGKSYTRFMQQYYSEGKTRIEYYIGGAATGKTEKMTKDLARDIVIFKTTHNRPPRIRFHIPDEERGRWGDTIQMLSKKDKADFLVIEGGYMPKEAKRVFSEVNASVVYIATQGKDIEWGSTPTRRVELPKGAIKETYELSTLTQDEREWYVPSGGME